MDETQVILARLEGKIDGIGLQLVNQAVQVADHEARLRAIEKKMWSWAGAIGLLSTVSASSALYIVTQK